MKIEIRPATPDDLKAFYGDEPRPTVRAVAVDADGELAAIAGVSIQPTGLTAFSTMRDVGAPKRLIWRTAQRLVTAINPSGVPVTARAEGRSKFLEKFGFVHIGTDNSEEVYQWKPCR